MRTFSSPRTPPQSKPAPPAARAEKLALREHWNLQSSAKVEAKGETISTAAFVPKGWHDATVPTTVVAALVKDKTLPDPFFAMNLRKFAGVTYPIGGNFSNIPMQTDSPYAVSWWYRKQFAAPAAYAGKTVWLNFKGINYRANVWLNGKQIANTDNIAGAWRTYELNVTNAVKPGHENVLAVQVFAPTESDLAITFVDWNPAPPDKNMGLWREVYLTTSGPVALRYPTVVSKLNLPAERSAPTHRHRTTQERHQRTCERQTERPNRKRGLRAGGRTRRQRKQRCDLHSRAVSATRLLQSTPLVARADGQAGSLLAENGIRSRPHRQRPFNNRVRHSRSYFRSERHRRPRLPHQRQEHPDPRRRLDVRT